MLGSIVDLLACWKGNFGEHTSVETWKTKININKSSKKGLSIKVVREGMTLDRIE
jgi:hypothetical protein